MATNKTLTPTNVTIAIPAMADKPDASVFSNCIDKEADAINTLNSNTTTSDLGTKTVSGFQEAIITLANSMVVNAFKNVSFVCSEASGVFVQSKYIGTISKPNSARIVVELHIQGSPDIISGYYNGTKWMWDKVAFNSNISTCMRKFTIGQVTSSTSITLSVSSRDIYGLLVGESSSSARHILAIITLRNGTAFCTTISSQNVTAQPDGNNIVITSDNYYGAILYLVPFNQDNVDNLVIT